VGLRFATKRTNRNYAAETNSANKTSPRSDATNASQARDSHDSHKQIGHNNKEYEGQFNPLFESGVKVASGHSHPPIEQRCCTDMTKPLNCVKFHDPCSKTKKKNVHIPKLDLKKVRDTQKHDEEGERSKTLQPQAQLQTSQSCAGCLPPLRRHDHKSNLRDQNKVPSDSKGSSTISALDSGSTFGGSGRTENLARKP
jgi:hypothetical protein